MSIFKESFPDFVRKELNNRQERLSDPNRRYELTTYQSTRNSFVRMTSGVNVKGDNGDLAKKYVLQGGILNETTAKSGVGNSFNNVYSNTSALGDLYARGIRPMPGIVNMTSECKTAYGSLIEAQVHFTCWDIKQLEDLELLFMRPGYTVLLEWGWAYSGQQPKFYDILDKHDIDFNKTNKELFEQCSKNECNYEAILGYVKNYQWSARPDGGYDCTTYIISLGEVLESLKMNYAPLNIELTSSEGKTGILKYFTKPSSPTQNFSNSTAKPEFIKDYYSKGILSGLLYEIQLFLQTTSFPEAAYVTGIYPDLYVGNKSYSVFKKSWKFKNNNPNAAKSAVGDTFNYYITLESLCDLVNTYVLPRNENASGDPENKTIFEITTKGRNYVPKSVADDLKCLAHPLQVSTDPTKCLIKSDIWINGGVAVFQNALEASNTPVPRQPISQAASNFIEKIPKTQIVLVRVGYDTPYSYLLDFILRDKPTTVPITKASLIKEFQSLRTQIENGILSINRATDNNTIVYNFTPEAGNGNTLDPAITTTNNSELGFNILAYMNYSSADKLYDDLKNAMKIDAQPAAGTKSDSTNKYPTAFRDFIINNGADVKAAIISDLGFTNTIPNSPKSGFITPYGQYLVRKITGSKILDTADAAKKALKGLNSLKPYFTDSAIGNLGYIKNIYLDIDALHSILINPSIESKDPQGKNVINVVEFFKTICQTIQECTGNMNNFDVHIDGRDNKARIVDLSITADATYDNLFQIELHNLKSMARNYKLESKIFPEQGAIIAISAQTFQESGQLGYNNSTLTSFNEGITDRLKPKVITPASTTNQVSLLSVLLNSFTQLNKYFALLNDSENNTKYAPGAYNNVLRDALGFFSSLENNPNRFSGIIPVMLSFDMDGFGGAVIGNLFKVNDDILPKSYKFGNSSAGRQLGFLVKSFSHKVENNDWITTIEAYPFIIPSKIDINATNINYWSQFVKAIEKINASSNINTYSNTPFESNVTFYYGRDIKAGQVIEGVKITSDIAKLEGGGKDIYGAKLNTIEDYLNNKAPYVSIAMDTPFKDQTLINPAFVDKKGNPIIFKCVDTGGAFQNKGLSKIDIATGNFKKSQVGGILNIDGIKFPSGKVDGWKIINKNDTSR